MLYQVDNLVLSEIRTVRENPDYTLAVCKDLNTDLDTHYVLLQIKNLFLKKALMACMEVGKRSASQEQPFVTCFLREETLCYVFSYDEQRNFSSFSSAQLVDTYSWEHAALHLVVACMSSPLPYPLLYLLLNDETINIARDNSIYFTNFFKLEDFDLKVKEVDCVSVCSLLVLHMLEKAKLGKKKKLKSLTLIEKKVDRDAYQTFAEIYKDIKFCAVLGKKAPWYKRVFSYLVERKDEAFKLLLTVSGMLLILAMIMLISQLIFGDASFLKFGYSINQIGTESMLK